MVESVYDAIVIGAGPAGAYASYCLAKNNKSVLLIEKSKFPRDKVCGSCLNQVALKELSSIKSFDQNILDRAQAINQIELGLAGTKKTFDFPPGIALERSILDQAIVDAAMIEGVEFLSQATATVQNENGHFRKVVVQKKDGTLELEARIVLVADGLNGQSLSQLKMFQPVAKADSLIGVGCLLDTYPDQFKPGKIYMASGFNGYVGAVVLKSGRLDMAAALDPKEVKASHGPGALCQKILESCQFQVPELLATEQFKGTISLTRYRTNIAAERIFVVGDAASYIEPFTGEGIAWALSSARAAAEVASVALEQNEWSNTYSLMWVEAHDKLVKKRQKTAKFFSWILKHPSLFRPLVATMDSNPWMMKRVSGYINSV